MQHLMRHVCMYTLSGQLGDPCEDRLTKIPTVLPYRCNPSSETKKPLEKNYFGAREFFDARFSSYSSLNVVVFIMTD